MTDKTPPPALRLPFPRLLAAAVAGLIAAGLAGGFLTHEQANTLGVLATSFGLVLRPAAPPGPAPPPAGPPPGGP